MTGEGGEISAESWVGDKYPRPTAAQPAPTNSGENIVDQAQWDKKFPQNFLANA